MRILLPLLHDRDGIQVAFGFTLIEPIIICNQKIAHCRESPWPRLSSWRWLKLRRFLLSVFLKTDSLSSDVIFWFSSLRSISLTQVRTNVLVVDYLAFELVPNWHISLAVTSMSISTMVGILSTTNSSLSGLTSQTMLLLYQSNSYIAHSCSGLAIHILLLSKRN